MGEGEGRGERGEGRGERGEGRGREEGGGRREEGGGRREEGEEGGGRREEGMKNDKNKTKIQLQELFKSEEALTLSFDEAWEAVVLHLPCDVSSDYFLAYVQVANISFDYQKQNNKKTKKKTTRL